MSDLPDLTKPLRLKETELRIYPVPGTDFDGQGHSILAAYRGTDARWNISSFCIDLIENIPDPIVRYGALYLYADGNISTIKSVSEDFNDNGGLRKTGYAIIKLTRTEDGKTRVEVCDET